MLEPQIWGEITEDLLRLEDEIAALFTEEKEPIRSAATHLLYAGGKRIRPALLLAAAKFAAYRRDELLPVAVALELVHTASLVHDDIVDRTDRRRGLPTVHQIWGDGTALLVGDYLFAKAFSLLAAQADSGALIALMAEIVRAMSEGEVIQIASRFNVAQTEADYLQRIRLKTATFLAVSCRLGARISGAQPTVAASLAAYGENIGMAFQIIDDCLDFTSRPETLGKPVGSDLRQGVITLPVINALQTPAARGRILPLLERLKCGQATDDAVTALNSVVAETGSLAYAHAKASVYAAAAQAALDDLPAGPARDILRFAADTLLERSA